MAKRPQFSEVQFGFDVRSDSPIDRRLVLTKEEMETMTLLPGCGKAINLAAVMPDDYLVLCADNGRLYHYSRLSGKECCDCSIDENKKDWPYGTSNGHFRLFTDVIDIVHKEGDSWESIVDKCGIAKVCSYEDMQTIYEEMERRFKNLDSSLAEKADKCEIDNLNIRIDKIVPRVEDLEDYKADKFVVMGSGDVLDSEGKPIPEPGTGGYGVHVTYDPVDKDGNPLVPKPEGVRGPVIYIDHESVVPAGGWISKYAIGGIAIGQAFPEGTRISEVWRQMLEGDPKADNVLCAAVSTALPEYWTDLAWRQFAVKRNELWDVTTGQPIPFEQWSPVIANQQYIMISLPLSMCHEDGTDLITEKRVRLNEVYNKNAPAFTYDFKWYDIKNNPSAEEVGYRVYYLTNKATISTPDLIWEFIYNNPDAPGYDDPDRHRV